MANARREVDLVVKAKDDAARVIDAITSAINTMVGAQEKLIKSGEKTDSTFGSLIEAVTGLEKVLKGASGTDKLAADIAKAEKAMQSLRAEVGAAEGDLAGYQAQAQKAATQTAKLRGESEKLEGTLKAQNATLDKTKTTHKSLTEELRKQEVEQGKLARAVPRLTDQITRQEARIAETTESYERLSAGIAAAETPSKSLQSQFEKTEQRLAKQNARLEELRTRLEASKVGLETTSASVAELSGKVEISTKAIQEQSTVLKTTRSALSDLKTQIKSAVAEERQLEDAAERVSDSLARQKSSLTSAEGNFEKLGAAAGAAETQMQELAAQAKGPLAAALSAQRGVVSQINQEFTKVRAELAKVGAEMDRVGVPTKELSDTYNLLKSTLRQIETEFARQKQSFGQLRGEYSAMTGDTAELTALTQKFEVALSESAAALKRVEQASNGAKGASERLGAATKEVAASQGRVVSETKQTKSATDAAAASTNKLSDAYRKLYGESRQAMSFTQRLRGEVLSLISAYGGIFAVVTLLDRTVQATVKLEQAQSRLNALYNGDALKAGEEYEFIQRQANRLGVDIGALADEYTKFAAATKGTVLAGEETRRIFLRVAEAGRVNGLSIDDMSGIFRALIQIASKGKVQLEELSGQLGDRLPGALQIMADGLGITVEALLDLTKKGEVSSSALSAFADNLEERYGAALPDALKTTGAALGRFQNAVTQALLAFGQGGFIEGFNDLLEAMTRTLQSADFKTFAANVSSAFGIAAKAAAFLAENFKLVVFAANAFLAIKLLPFLGGLALGVGRFATTLNQAAIAQRVMAREATVLGTTAAATAGRVGLLGTALRGLGAGPVGLAVTAIVGVLTYWLTSADDVNEAMTKHEEIMQRVKGAYDQNKKSVEEWRKELALVSTQSLLENIEATKDALETIRARRLNPFELVDTGIPEIDNIAQAVVKLTDQFFNGEKGVKEYAAEMDELSKKAVGVAAPLKGAIEAAIANAEADAKVIKATQDAADALDVKAGSTEKATEAMNRLAGVNATTTDSTTKLTEGTTKYNEALEEMKSLIPEINKGLDEMKDKAKLDEAFQSAARAATTMSQLAGAVSTYNTALNAMLMKAAGKDLQGITDGVEAAATILRDREQFRADPYMDVNHLRVGFGSDTITLADNSVKEVVAGMKVSVADANRDLYRRIGEFNDTIKSQVGDKFTQFTAAQQGVLTSIAYNYGKLPESLAKVINAGGSDEQIAQAIRDLQTDNAGVNKDRRLYEAAAFTGGTDVTAETKAYLDQQKKITEEKEKQTEKAKDLADTEANALETAQLESSLKNADVIKRETELEIAKKKQEYEAAGVEFTKATEDSIRKRIALQYQEQSLTDAIASKKKAAEEADQKTNDLIQQRTDLLKQAKILSESGDTAGAQTATQQADALKSQIDAAAASAIKMWEAVGGTEASSAIEKLKLATLESKNLASSGNAVSAMWQQTGQIIGDNLVNAFDEFAQAVANGENAWKALGTAIQKAAAQILIDIGKMIVKQAIFNAISGVFGLTPGSNGLFHSGTALGSGTIGSNMPNRTKSVSPMAWANAPRFHTGYNGGLKNNEIPAILEETEAVLTQDSPFHPKNQAKTMAAASGGGGMPNIKIVNAIDAGDFVSEGLNTAVGETAMLNFIRKNKSSFKEVVS